MTMRATLTNDAAARHLLLQDVPTRMAKVDVLKQDISWRQRLALALNHAIGVLGWSDKEAAARIGIDAAELGRWLRGERAISVERVMEVDELGEAFASAYFSRVRGVETITEYRVRRPA